MSHDSEIVAEERTEAEGLESVINYYAKPDIDS